MEYHTNFHAKAKICGKKANYFPFPSNSVFTFHEPGLVKSWITVAVYNGILSYKCRKMHRTN